MEPELNKPTDQKGTEAELHFVEKEQARGYRRNRMGLGQLGMAGGCLGLPAGGLGPVRLRPIRARAPLSITGRV